MLGGELSEPQRVSCLSLAEAGVGTKQIAATIDCTQRAVRKTKQRWNKLQSYGSAARSGRPYTLSDRDVRRLYINARKNKKINYRRLLEGVGLWDRDEPKPKVSTTTVRRALDREGLRRFRAKRRPKIDPAVAKERLAFARAWQKFPWEKETVKFSDECSVVRGSGSTTPWIWRLPSEKWHSESVEQVSTLHQPSRMLWAAIWMTAEGKVGRSRLIIMKRDETAPRHGYTTASYLNALYEGLEEDYKPGEWFMQDNARIYTANRCKEWLESHGIATIEWPRYSPDLNPIEHMWWALKKKLRELYPELEYMGESVAELDRFELCLMRAWSAIPDSFIKTLLTSMPRRLKAVIQAKGNQTKY